jgi:hypothetical protein
MAWLAFTIIRGIITDWWAYWFLNPNLEAGVSGVAVFIMIIVVFGLVSASISLALNKLSNRSKA